MLPALLLPLQVEKETQRAQTTALWGSGVLGYTEEAVRGCRLQALEALILFLPSVLSQLGARGWDSQALALSFGFAQVLEATQNQKQHSNPVGIIQNSSFQCLVETLAK